MDAASKEPKKWLVYITTPENFVSWPRAEKVRFYEKVVDWHDYIETLQDRGHVEGAWGSQKILGEQSTPITTKTVLVAKLNASPDKFSQILAEDPLWNYGVYYAPMLKSIEGDYEDDLARFNRVRDRLQARLQTALPEPQLKFQEAVPEVKPGGKLDFLVTMRNGPGYIDHSDEARLAIEERVLQFHDYHNQLRQRGIIVDDGACFPIWGYGMRKEAIAMSGYWIVRTSTYDEFSSVLLADPLLVVMTHLTIALIPFEESQRRATRDLKAARAHLE